MSRQNNEKCSIVRPDFLDSESVYSRLSHQVSDASHYHFERFLDRANKRKELLRAILGNDTLVWETETHEMEKVNAFKHCIRAIRYAFDCSENKPYGFLTDAEILNNKLSNGQKLSRFMARNNKATNIVNYSRFDIYKELKGLPDWEAFEKLSLSDANNIFFNVFYDNLSKMKSSIVLTCSPLEQLCASEFTSDWSSCYSFDGGYSGSGTAQAMNRFTLMAYTFNSSIRRKTGRLWIHLDIEQHSDPKPEVLRFATIGEYGNAPNSVLRSVRHKIQFLLSDWQGLPNRWKYSESGLDRFEQDSNGSAPYIDSAACLVRHASLEPGDFAFSVDHSNPICMSCGDDHKGSNMVCEDCDEMEICEHCNDRVHREDAQHINGETYCESCFDDLFSSCADCGDTTPNDELNETVDGDVCGYCLRHHYSACYDCGEHYRDGDLILGADGENYCESCHESRFTFCFHCGDSVDHDDIEVFEGKALCENCLDRYARECVTCGDLTATDDGQETPSGFTCDSCMEDEDEETPELEKAV